MNLTARNHSATDQEESTSTKVIQTLAYATIYLVSLVGNILLILSVKRNINGRMRTVSNLLIASLAVSDLMLTIWSFPERVTRTITKDAWLVPSIGGSILCKIVNFTEKLSITVSVLHLGALSFDRFLVVFYPYRTIIKRGFVKYIAGSIWVFSAIYWSPILYYGKIIGNENIRCEVRRFVTHWRKWYLTFIVILCFIMLGILILYTALAIRLCCRKNTALQLASQHNKSERIKRRVVVMVGVIIITFYVCFLPYWVGWVWCSYAKTMPKAICNETYKFISIFLSNTSCITNPIICFTFIGYFRFAFRAIFQDPINRRPRELRARTRRKSSQTELDSVYNNQSKNSGKDENYLQKEKQTAKNEGDYGLTTSKTPLINSIEQNSFVVSPVEQKNECTVREGHDKLLQNSNMKTTHDTIIDKDSDEPKTKESLVIYSTPL